jgi:hypothetical protein
MPRTQVCLNPGRERANLYIHWSGPQFWLLPPSPCAETSRKGHVLGEWNCRIPGWQEKKAHWTTCCLGVGEAGPCWSRAGTDRWSAMSPGTLHLQALLSG